MTTRRTLRRRGRTSVQSRVLQHQTLERRELLAAEILSGPRLVSIETGTGVQIRTDGLANDEPIDVAPRELTFRFDGVSQLDEQTLAGIRIIPSGGDGTFDGDEIFIQPGFRGFADDEVGQRVVVVRFNQPLDDDSYRISIAGYDDVGLLGDPNSVVVALRDLAGNAILPADQVNSPTPTLNIDFDVELGPQVVAVVPQPISGVAGSRTQARDEIHVYFNEDPLSNPLGPMIVYDSAQAGAPALPVVDPAFYRLILTQDTVENSDDLSGAAMQPTRVTYDPARSLVVLTFASDLSTLPGVTDGVGTFRLRIGSGDSLPAAPTEIAVPMEASSDNDTFGSASPIATFTPTAGIQSVLLDGGVIQNTGQYVPPWPGAYEAPGSRDQRRDASVTGRIDTTVGINIFPYNFADRYGLDPQSNPLDNAITPAQIERAREVLDLYEEHLGVRFVETEDSGLQIVTGDIRAIQQTADTGAGEGTPYSLFRVNERDPSRGVLVLEAGEPWFNGYGLSPDDRPSWFVETLRGVGNLLGIGALFELPDGVAAGGSSPDEPNSEVFSYDGSLSQGVPSDIRENLAGFPDIPSEPDFLSQSDITLGQALHRPESSDVDFYSFTVNPSAGGADGTLGRLTLETFAQRLDNVSLLDTLIQLYRVTPVAGGGNSYELIARNDDAFSDDSLIEIDLTAGDYIVGVSSTGNDGYNGELAGTGRNGRTEGDYQLRLTFDASLGTASGNTLTDSSGTRLDGDADGVAGGNFNYWFRTAPDNPAATTARTIFVSKDSDGDDNSNNGSLVMPYETVARALEVARPGDIVRLLPAHGADLDVTTVADNQAYEIGRGGANDTPLVDGETFEIPRNVTVMIDAGALLKLRDAKIVAGSESVDEDRSLAAIQVLGTPESSVVFTSYNDESFGIDTNLIATTPVAGDWAGVELRNDVDYAEGRGVWEREGIFLDYLSHADLRYGGGRVRLQASAVSPIQLDESRPTLIYNSITFSANSAISADPNSFREDNFHAPRYQPETPFTSDYSRIGPEIFGNTLINNSINALFVRVDTPAAGVLEEMTVSGRFDDTDVVHSISQTLTIAGNPGGPILLEDRPDVSSVTLTAGSAGKLPVDSYDYLLTFVTVEGSESLVSLPTRTASVVGANGSITLNNLPVAPAEFAGRNLYRSQNVGGVITYELVEQLDRRRRQFVDVGNTRGGSPIGETPVLDAMAPGLSFTSLAGQGSLERDRFYDYRFTFEDVFGGESRASLPSMMVRAEQDGAIRIDGLPPTPDGFVGTNVYRNDPDTGQYFLIAKLRLGETTLLDDGRDITVDGSLLGRMLGRDADGGTRLLPRFDARLTVDPNVIVKLDTSRIEATFGADFYAEGQDGRPIIFTSRKDDNYGIGGTFDTNNDGPSVGDAGDWGGIMLRQGVTGSLDYVDLRYGGGEAPIEGGLAEFNALEILQAEVRVTNSSFVANADGFDPIGDPYDIRVGRGFNDASTIFIRGAQPILAGNVIANSDGAAISINPDALSFQGVTDPGRSTGSIDRILDRPDNQGPLLVGNELTGNDINGMRVRGEIVTTDSVWDDADVVHVVEQPIYSLTQHYYGALRLRSDVDESLVVKFGPQGSLIGGGRPLDIDDRIGGTLQVLGAPGFPVVLTSLADNTIGAGFTPDGISNTQTLGNGSVDPQPGDWVGLQLLSYANDRNVAYVYESERAEPGAITANATPDDAQDIGTLATREFAGDENERLGITVRGTLTTRADFDVYRFSATGGTPVYIDIDETTSGLDTVVELLTENGEVIARSDNSLAEAIGNEAIFVDESLPEGVLSEDVRSLPTGLSSGNVESPNPFDAGMRIVLPGDSTENTNYFVRVRTSGVTAGQYELSLRLRASDEVAGSTIRGADIRFATTAIDVSGAPIHSPLVGDRSEDIIILDPTPADRNSGDESTRETVDTRLDASRADAQALGNLLTTDRGSLIVTGEIGNLNNSLSNPQLFTSLLDERLEDVDVYRVDLFAEQLEPDTFDNENRYVTTTFDIDYADELGRVNTVLSVFDSLGRLILMGRDSNVTDDQGTPGEGVDQTNLSGGSAGVLDAYIGPVELPEGTYFVAVSNEAAVPAVIDQFFADTATNPDVRLMPLNSVRPLSRDSLEEIFLDRIVDYTAEEPIIEPAFSAASAVDYTLDDIRLFVSYDAGIGGGNRSTLASFNPFTGTMERLIGSNSFQTNDLAIRRDGELFSYSTFEGTPFNEGSVGSFVNVSPVDGSGNDVGDDGIRFFQTNQAGSAMEGVNTQTLLTGAIALARTTSSSSINGTAVTDARNERLWVVGTRSGQGRGGEIPFQLTQNIVYQADAATGNITWLGSENDQLDRSFANQGPYSSSFGPATDELEFGIVDTGFIDTASGKDGGLITGTAIDPNDGGSLPDSLVAVTDQGGIHTFDPSLQPYNPFFPNDPNRYTSTEQFLVFPDGDSYDRVIATNYYGRLEAHPDHFGAQFDPATGTFFPIFSGLSYGPRFVENGAYRDVLFGTTPDGWLYAFTLETAPNGTLITEPANVFFNGRSAIELTFFFGGSVFAQTSGLAFSNLEVNPWHVTPDRFGDDGHGQVTPYDISRQPLAIGGGSSLYFGFEITNNAADNTLSRPDGDPLGEIAPGGSHGSMISEPFDLREYSPDDKPTLYFTYHIEVEDNDDYQPGPPQQRDSFRVFAAGDDGVWRLLATNDDFRALPLDDEYDEFNVTGIPVQTVFDDNADGQWRQVRADLSPLAGSRDVRIRFDFSTAGSMRSHFGSVELIGVDAETIADNDLTLLSGNFPTVLQTVVGRDVVFPAGNILSDGQSVVVEPAGGAPVTIRFVNALTGTAGPLLAEVLIDGTDTAADVAAAVAAAVPAVLQPRVNGNGRISFLSAVSVQVDTTIRAGQSNPIPVVSTAGQILTPDGDSASAGEQIIVTPSGGGAPTVLTYVRSGPAAAGNVVFDSGDSTLTVANAILAQLPAGLAFVDSDGNINFLDPGITLAVIPAPTAIAISETPNAMVRTLIDIKPGSELNDDELLTFNYGAGPALTYTVAFDDADGVPGSLAFDASILFDDSTSALAIRNALIGLLPAALDVMAVDSDTISVLSNFDAPDDVIDQRPNLFAAQSINAYKIDLPQPGLLIDGEQLTITVDGTPQVVIFDDATGVSSLGTVVFNGPATAGSNDNVGVIANRLANIALPGTFDVGVSGGSVVIYGNTVNVTDPQAGSAITVTPLNALDITVPSGDQMNDRDTIDIDAIGPAAALVNTDVITLLERRTNTSGGPDVLPFDSVDTATSLRNQLTANNFLSPFAVAVDPSADPAANRLRVVGDSVLFGTPPEGVTVMLEPVIKIDFPSVVDLRTGERLDLVGGGVTASITFIRAGESIPLGPTEIPVFFDETTTDVDLGTRIVSALSGLPELAAVSTPTGFGLAIRNLPGFPNFRPAGAAVNVNPQVTFIGTSDIDTYAIPMTFPNGMAINPNETIEIFRKDAPLATVGEIYTFRTAPTAAPNEIIYSAGDTAQQVTAAVLAALDLALLAQPVGTSGHEIQVIAAASIVTEPGSAIVSFEAEEERVFSGGPLTRAVPVLVNSTMDSVAVTSQLQRGLSESLGRIEASVFNFETTATMDDYKTYGGDRIRVYNTFVSDPGPYGFNDGLISDSFGLGVPTSFSGNSIGTAGASNNEVEGVYIDDIIVGFAERGEAVIYENYLSTGVNPANAGYVLDPAYVPDTRPQDSEQPENPDEVLVGAYSLEIRTSDEYGVPQDYDPINLILDEEAAAGRSFDSNDRLATGAVSIVAPAGVDLIDGDMFVLDDGTARLTFEFDSRYAPGVGDGNVAVVFDPVDTNARIARAIRDAINSDQATDALDIVAATGDGRDIGASTSGRVELFGENIVAKESILVNPGSGRTIKLDMVAEETFAGNYTSRRISIIDHDADTVEYFVYGNELAQAAVPGYVPGDTLFATGKIGDQVNIGIPGGGVSADDGAVLFSDPTNDIDTIRVYLEAGKSIDIDVDTTGLYRDTTGLELPIVAIVREGMIFSSNQLNLQYEAFSDFTMPTFGVGETQPGAFIQFTPTETGYYDIIVSSTGAYFGGGVAPQSVNDRFSGEYALNIRPTSDPGVPARDVLMVDYQFGITDVNRVREQGQIIIEGNFIRDSADTGIAATIGETGQTFVSTGTTPLLGSGVVQGTAFDDLNRPGSARLLRNINPTGLIPGAVIVNNVVERSGNVAIRIEGGDLDNGQTGTPNLFSRVVNNTLVRGDQGGIGIEVSGRAAPTILNNVLVDFDTGLNVDTATASGTESDANLFRLQTGQTAASVSTLPLGSTSIVVAAGTQVFANEIRSIYIPNVGSSLIDNSVASLSDRDDFVDTVKDPVGIAPSPILAPDFDIYGQRRVDGITGVPDGGTGLNVFVDRGAVDRSDFRQPTAVLNDPFDAPNQAAAGAPDDPTTIGDTDPATSFVRLVNQDQFVEFFEIQLIDEAGTGLDPSTVNIDTVLLTENGRQILPDRDFTFGYSENSRTIRLTPLAGVWNQDSVYEITLNNQTRLALEVLSGGSIADGDPIVLTDPTGPIGRETVFEFDSGFSLQVPQTSTIVVTDLITGFNDTDRFTITSPDGATSVTFEINISGITAPSTVEIDLQSARTIADVREAILRVLDPTQFTDSPANAINYAALLDLRPRAIGNDAIQLGTLPGHLINFAGGVSGLRLDGMIAGVADGQQFNYITAGQTITFEFDSDGSIAAVDETATFRGVPFSRSDTPDQLAESIAESLREAVGQLISSRGIGDGLVSVGGSIGDQIDPLTSPLTVLGSPGVTPSLSVTVPVTTIGVDLDNLAATVSVTVGTQTEVFRFTTDPLLASPDRIVVLDPADGSSVIASKLGTAIQLAFENDLNVSSNQNVLTLGEIPAGQSSVFTVVDPINSGLVIDGVSGGAIAVPYVPSNAFSATSVAASLQLAIQNANLGVDVFTPGGGVLLIEGATTITGSFQQGNLPFTADTVPAVTDLAGNPVSATRPNGETRFTIIMPEVRFDFGDAPPSYNTLIIDDGARHTVDRTRLPRLGEFVDTESDGQSLDDALLNVTLSQTSVSGDVFSIDSMTNPNADRVTLNFMPQGGETLTVSVGSTSRTFELVEIRSNPVGSDVVVPFRKDVDTLDQITTRLINAIRATIPQTDDGLLIAEDADTLSVTTLAAAVTDTDPTISVVDAGVFDDSLPFDISVQTETMRVTAINGNTLTVTRAAPVNHPIGATVTGPTSLVITSIDDEDGVLQGLYTDPISSIGYNLFLKPGTDTANVLADDVLGFLNPDDPAGTNIAIDVRGTGLLHAWIDFDQSGTFEPNEQVISNLPVSGDPVTGSDNFVTVFTPNDANDQANNGMTWMRVRISESGNLQPSGVAVGGEIEDHLVQIIRIPLPDPDDDAYTIDEDMTLDTVALFLPPVAEGDFIPSEAFLPVQYILGQPPENGMVSLDATTGHFIYQPSPDFNGVDTFTYRLSTQQNESVSAITLDSFATVTINVLPINDQPSGVDKPFTALEDLPLTISASQLLAGAQPDAEPLYVAPPISDPLEVLNAPFLNEENQRDLLVVTAVEGSGGTPITAANAASAAGNLVVSQNGPLGLNLEVSNSTAGDLVSISFVGTTATFELVAVGDDPQANTIPVQILAGDTNITIADRLRTAIDTQFSATVPGVTTTSTGNLVSLAVAPEAALATGSATFTITQGATGSVSIDVVGVPKPTAAATATAPNPTTGDTLTVTIGAATPLTFELIAAGATPTSGNIPITLLPFNAPTPPGNGATQAEIDAFNAAVIVFEEAVRDSAAAQLAAAIQAQFTAADLAAVATVDGLADSSLIEISPAAITAGKSFKTARGSGIAVFDTLGALIEVRYISDQDLNRDNPPPAIPSLTDEFTFTVRDNGVSIDLVNNGYVYGTPLDSVPATVTLDVAPRNDLPLLNPDVISVGPLGPDADTVDTPWEDYFTAQSLTAPIPTEDQSLTIDTAFLLLNDEKGPLTAADENPVTSANDIGLTVESVTMLDPSQGTVTLQGTTIVFTPGADIFGDVIFSYSARDRGFNEGLFGVDSRFLMPLTSFDGMVTVAIQPVNDAPVAYDRSLTYNESGQAGPGDPFVFTRDDLINGLPTETPAAPGDFAPTLAAPFNESEQTLRVVSFATAAGSVDVSDLPGPGTGTLTLASDAGGTFDFDFVDGIFTEGRFTSADDFDQDTPFVPTEPFTYVIADDGLTTSPQDGSIMFNLPDARSDDDLTAAAATVTITIFPTNDAPTFDINAPVDVLSGLPTLDVLERDDSVGTVVVDFAINILPGPPTAIDETARQDVVFTFPAALNTGPNVPPGLFTQLPELSPDGQLTLYPAPDMIGVATFVVEAEDFELVPGPNPFSPRTTLKTFVVNVQPVNDAPRFDPTVAGTSDSDNPDDQYTVGSVDFNNDGQIDSAPITYTLKEDNTQAMGVLQDYFIPLNAAPSVGYSRIGLLDVFTVGPDNEADPLAFGGSQVVEFFSAGNDPVSPSLDRTTDRGGILTPVFDTSDVLIGLNYRPPLDFNSSFAGTDSFTYVVRDDSTVGGETFSLAAGALVPDRLTTSNRVELVMNPVNDRPEFTLATLEIAIQEDTSAIQFANFASNISAGPPNTAFDEVDINTGQLVEFTVTSLDFPREDADDFFSFYPTISEETGLLIFQPAADVFGEYRFEVVLTDENRDGSISDNTLRGDLISSIPVTMTINVQPVNDPPIVDPTAEPLEFSILEDGFFDILVSGDNTSPGLLDPFFPGPFIGATDEAANIAPQLGGNQTVSLGSPIPTTSAEGGNLQFLTASGTPRLRYTPRPNFVGTDSFIYTVIDDGITVGIDGLPFSDPRIASNTVTFEVLPVNDAPLFSGAANVSSIEDEGAKLVANWATNVQAGPPTAIDELNGIGSTPPQALQFVFTQTSSNPELFLSPPTAIIDPVTGTASLTYETNPDANGFAVFEVVLQDSGPRDGSIGDMFVSDPPRTFAIDVAAVNDPPTFALQSNLITRPEDSGPLSVLQAINISPGPADEQSQTVSFEIEPLAPEFQSLFSELPTINSNGVLRFTPAANQNTDNVNGPAVIRVVARDSLGAEAAAVEFQIEITEVNDSPRAVSDTVNTDEDTVLVITDQFLKLNDIDPDLQTNAAEVIRVVLPAQSFSVSGAEVSYDATTGEITYDPTEAIAVQALAPGQTLVDSFAYSLIDAAGFGSNLTTVALNVSGINDAPIVELDTPQLSADGPTVIRVLDNDNDVDGFIVPSSVRITLQPAFGNVVVQPDGTVIYTAFASFTGEDIFAYTVADNLGLQSEESQVTISANASPIAVNDAKSTFLDEATFIDVAANDSDPDGTLDLGSIIIVDSPNRGAAIPQADGTVQYLPDPGFLGRDSFQYRIADTQGRLSNIATVDTQVVASRLQNPDQASDVNDDGFVTAIDALLIVNRLSRAGGAASIPVLETDFGPNYYDVSGNQLISSADALRVINEIGRQNGLGIAAEQVPQALLATDEESVPADALAPIDLIDPIDLIGPAKIVDVASSVSVDVVDLIASDRDADTDEETVVAAVDAAMADLL